MKTDHELSNYGRNEVEVELVDGPFDGKAVTACLDSNAKVMMADGRRYWYLPDGGTFTEETRHARYQPNFPGG